MVEAIMGWKGLSGSDGGRSGRRTSAGIVGVREVAGMDWGHRGVYYEAIEDAT